MFFGRRMEDLLRDFQLVLSRNIRSIHFTFLNVHRMRGCVGVWGLGFIIDILIKRSEEAQTSPPVKIYHIQWPL